MVGADIRPDENLLEALRHLRVDDEVILFRGQRMDHLFASLCEGTNITNT